MSKVKVRPCIYCAEDTERQLGKRYVCLWCVDSDGRYTGNKTKDAFRDDR